MILYELFHYLNHTLMFGVSRLRVLKVVGLMLLAFDSRDMRGSRRDI